MRSMIAILLVFSGLCWFSENFPKSAYRAWKPPGDSC